MHWLAILILLLQLASPLSPPVSAQTGEEEGQAPGSVLDSGSQAAFGEKIAFYASAQPSAGLGEVLVSFTPQGQETHLEKMELDETGEAAYEISIERLPLAPFSRIKYSFEARWDDGTKAASPEYVLEYDDTRFDWQDQESGIFEVHWNGDDATLGQDLLNIAQAGLETAQGILPADPPETIRIYAYSSARDLQEAARVTSETWIAGHSMPELGLILVSVPSGPEKKLELQRQIPHEIMHVLQYQVTGSNFNRQPAWLIEGLASLAEMYPNPDYSRVLEETANADELIPMENLCSRFPSEAGPAFIAYAQSESFLQFLHQTYGMTGLLTLVDLYQDGLGCDEGVTSAFGSSLGQLEYRWKQEVLGLLVPALLTFLPVRAKKPADPLENQS